MSNQEPKNLYEDFPFPLCLYRVSDQMMVSANKSFRELFGYTLEDISQRSVWEIVASVDWDLIVNEASRRQEGGEEVDIPSTSLLTFRRSDGLEFIGWFRVRDITDSDGVVSHRAGIVLKTSSDIQAQSLYPDLTNLQAQNYLSSLTGNAAHEVNNSLVVLQEFFEGQIGSFPNEQEMINRALQRLAVVGLQLSRIGNKAQVEIPETNGLELTSSSIFRRHGSVLVVDDDVHLLAVISELLQSAGYTVWSVANISEALECCKKVAIDCALVDVQLGDDLGTYLADEITAVSPNIQVIMMSGFSRHVEVLRLDGKYQFLRKPFAMFDLLEMIQKAVDRD